MATVHPSRMGLVPQDPPTYYQGDTRGRLYSSRRRSPSPRFNNDSDYRQSSRRRYEERDSRRRSRDRSESRGRSVSMERTRRRSRSKSRSRDRRRDGGYKEENAQGRRRSPEYGDYRRPSPPRRGDSPQPLRRQQGDMYANRRDYERLPYNPGPELLESRRKQRQSAQANVWPKSPKAPARSMSQDRGKARKKSKRSRSASISDSDSSSDEDERRRRKERKRARKERERERKHKKKRSSRSRRRSVDAVSEDEHRSRRRRSLARSRTGTPAKEQQPPSLSRSPSPSAEASDGDWVEKPVANAPIPIAAHVTDETVKGKTGASTPSDYYSDDEVGPVPLIKSTGKQKVDERAYGGALLRGEGSAMAAYLRENTDARIPRRGEIGLTSDQIADFENVGYVMSGSRHRRMNAVRIRKENQVISAEEKRGILKLQKEEQARREAILQEEFKELVDERLKTDGPSENT